MGGYCVDRLEDWLHGEACGVGCGRLARCGDAPGATTVNGSGSKRWSGKPRASSGERDSAQGVGLFCQRSSTAGSSHDRLIDDHREAHGVEPICEFCRSPVDLSAHRRRAHPAKARRARRDAVLREKSGASSTTISRFMRAQGLAAVLREGESWRVARSSG